MHLKTDTSSNAHYSRVPTISKPRNSFSIAEKHVTTIQFDYLYPLYTKFIYPGDTLAVTQQAMARLQTQIAPLYDDLYIDIHAWFVPMRLLQTNWARFQFNAQPGGPTQDNSALTTPRISMNVSPGGIAFPDKSLYDYLGYNPIGQACAALEGVEHFNNYLARGYALIWNENYRDENLQSPVTVDLDDGPDDPDDYVLLKRGRRHDRFSSCLTSQQKGTAVTLGGTVSVLSTSTAYGKILKASDHSVLNTTEPLGHRDQAGNAGALRGTTSDVDMIYDPNGSLTATIGSINDLRISIAVQQLLEGDARGGTRDVESIAHRWGVQVPDFRLQRPEYLGGATFQFDGHIVPQTSESGTTPQANLAQFSQTMTSFGVNHSFVEHGVFMMIMSCRSNVTYQQGILRELNYETRYDFYQPEFANLGEVAVKNKEIYFQNGGSGTDVINNATFGYQEYGYELRYSMNRVSGEMRSNYATSLDSRHMADDYTSLPTLGSAWIQSNTPISRNIAVAATTADPIQLNTLVTGTIARTLPMYSIPGLLRL